MSFPSGQIFAGRPVTLLSFTGLSLILSVVITFILSALGLMAGLPICGLDFPIAVGVSLIVAGCVCRPERSCLVWSSLLTSGIIAVALLIGCYTIDYSYDGLVYHQEIIALLCNGWNPYREGIPFGPDGPLTSIWALHYAKGIEMTQTATVSFIGKLEGGKCINFIMTAGTAFIIGDFVALRNPSMSRRSILLITLAVIANPVIWEQILTYYIDFYKYLYLLLLLVGIVEADSSDGQRRIFGYLLIGTSVVMSVATKFNFFFEAGLWGLCALVWVLVTSSRQLFVRLLSVGLISFAVAIALTFHPYVTNWLAAGHPLYPLMGEGAVDIMTDNTTEMFSGYDRVMNFFRSLVIPSMQIDVDQRNCGFTFFMPFILLLTLITAIRLRREVKGAVWFTATLCLLSCFLFEQTWWPRYICQLWLIPSLFLPQAVSSRSGRRSGRLTGLLMIFAGAYAFLWSLKHEAVIGSYNYLLLREASRQPVEIVSPAGAQYRRHLDDAGCYYKVIDMSPDSSGYLQNEGKRLLYFVERRRPLVIVSQEQAEAIRTRMEGMHLNYIRHEFNAADDVED